MSERDGDRTSATRVLPTPSPRATTPPPFGQSRETPMPRTSVRPLATDDALRRDEIARMSLLSRLMLVLGVLGLGVTARFEIDDVARAALLATAGTNFVAYGLVLYMTWHPSRRTISRSAREA